MTNIINWIKTHKAVTLLALVVVWMAWPRVVSYVEYGSYGNSASNYSSDAYDLYGAPTTRSSESVTQKTVGTTFPPYEESTPQNNANERMVVTTTTMSIVVSDVADAQELAIAHAETVGGYMVSSSLSFPEESPYAMIVLRIPSEKVEAAVNYFRSLGIKVPMEYVSGQDVTDQYTDIDAHLENLYATKSRYEEIREKAETVEELLSVQQHLTTLQNQIDSYIGQQRNLEQTAALAKVTLNLSADELALPYAAPQGFRPSVIFRYAVRSLMGTFADMAGALIWIGVYGMIWIPIGIVIFAAFIWRRRRRI